MLALLLLAACGVPSTPEDFYQEVAEVQCDGWEAYVATLKEEEDDSWTREDCEDARYREAQGTAQGYDDECAKYTPGKAATCLDGLEAQTPEEAIQGSSLWPRECAEVCGHEPYWEQEG